MKFVAVVLSFSILAGLEALCPSLALRAQEANSSANSQQKPDEPPQTDSRNKSYSGMYTFLKDGEFVQVTVEDGGRVTGFISRYGDTESDKGTFLDQFFKTGKLDGDKLTFSTEIVHGTSFDFAGAVARGEGKNAGDEAYYVLKGTLMEKISDADKKVTSHSREVVFKSFPAEATSQPPQH